MLLAVAVLAAGPARAAGESYSRAQTELFATPHLENVTQPETLHYDFRRSGAAARPLDDSIDVIVTEVRPDGRKNLSFRFLSGPNQRRFPPVEGFRGNPLIMLFLERDVAEMAAATGGSPLYFRTRLRAAFGTDAQVEDVTLPQATTSPPDASGAKARLVTVEPFARDPMIDRFPRYKDKRYEFLLSAAVPGGVERLTTILPAASGGQPAVEETVTFGKVEP
ncbi:hypothetical protein SAMN06265365_10921 [Tistlia consotensis]|uniref:Uncharacterized protein n=1 Tax=Tistlia consotensis USBA 355 TaxID=560819 RepID=A0A1Y6CWM4_9PROT|nr:hypothetical protein [Tistlia consotensis]SMF80295.1 hypothetical protein SAMN05428998_14121 [Tistlia consotensis USBA 355]SNR62443.1 hypothetical protein SAMN06265365_10921 [Tistlia consotensis]